MEGIRRWRPSPALVIAFIALFVAGAGTATAARLISGRSIKNNSVTGRDIRNNSLGNGDVKNGSLLRRDFRRGQLPAGAQGPAGRNGANGFGVLRYISRGLHRGGQRRRRRRAPPVPGRAPTRPAATPTSPTPRARSSTTP